MSSAGCVDFQMVLESCDIGSLASIYNDTDRGFDEDFIAYMMHESLQVFSSFLS